MLVDIDLAMKNEDFHRISPDVKDYIVELPPFVKGKNWRCYSMEIRYNEITIEIGGNNCKIRDSKTGKWQRVEGLSKAVNKKYLEFICRSYLKKI